MGTTVGRRIAITQAAVGMHGAFHLEREHVATNLCPCDGCVQADNLKLKFVAHIGEVASCRTPLARAPRADL